jgi:polysaccharide chain length determinant protein (PEP-CTERM system associated)
MNLSSEQPLRVLAREAFHHRRFVVGMFASVVLLMLVAGIVSPKGYTASTTILVDEKNIIQPLMQGAAVTTEVGDRAKMAREVISGRKIMNQILELPDWKHAELSLVEQESRIDEIVKRTSITNIGKNIIRIEYRDDEAARAFHITEKLAELFIGESLGAKAAESLAAFEFIDKQTREYHDKLMQAEESLKEFRSANIDSQPGSDGDISTRMAGLQTRIEQTTQELREAEIRKASLEKQLSGEAESASVLSREGQYRTRIGELQSQLETLRLSYHDTYPDIVRIRHQIADLNEEIVRERERRENAKTSGRPVLDENIVNNPMYQQLKRDLSQNQVLIDTLRARIGQSRSQLDQVIDRGKRVHGSEATLAELTRDYQVNREIYQDLLKRRENARVSMNLDKERQGLSFRIQEPATLPQTPSGLRFGHFVLLGILLGLIVPAGVLHARLQWDPRIRAAGRVGAVQGANVIAAIPHLLNPVEKLAVRRELEWLVLAAGATFGMIALVSALRLMKVV